VVARGRGLGDGRVGASGRGGAGGPGSGAARRTSAGAGNVEGERVLESLLVLIEGDNDAVDGLVTELAVHLPLELAIVDRGLAESLDGLQRPLVLASDQADGNRLPRVCGAGRPHDTVGRASRHILEVSGLADDIEAGGLGKNRAREGEDGGERVTHFGG